MISLSYSEITQNSVLFTSLGEKGTEALVRVGSFALLGQVTIGLDKEIASVRRSRVTTVSFDTVLGSVHT